MLTLEQLRIFVAVAERNHLTRAAAAVFLTPSAVSSAIRSLELAHDIQLFDRIGRGIVLTGSGRVFLEHARATLASAAATELMLSELGGTSQGHIRIHASQTIASYWLPQPLVRFHYRYPGLKIALTVGNTRSVAQAVRSGDADVGLVEGQVEGSLLQIRPVSMDRLVVVVAPHHPWADGRRVSVTELTQSQWISRESGSGTRSVFEDALQQHGIAPEALDTVLSFPSNEAVLSALEASDCAAALSELVAAPGLTAGRLVRVAIELPLRAFSLLTHPDRYRTRAAQALVDFLAGEDQRTRKKTD